MRGLYQVYIVDPEDDKIIAVWGPEVAFTGGNAQMKAIAKCSPFGKDIDDLDFVAVRLGEVREKKEVQTVKVVKE